MAAPLWSSLHSLEGSAALSAWAKALRVSETLLQALSSTQGRLRNYSTFVIPKKREGHFRVLHAPSKDLKKVQRRLLDVLSDVAPPHRCATAFVRRRPRDLAPTEAEALGITPSSDHPPLPPAIVEHAKLHCDKRVVYALDLQDFFPTITWPRVYGLFQSAPFGASKDVARLLANLTCHLPRSGSPLAFLLPSTAQDSSTPGDAVGGLPQGAPTSPLLSNLICWRLDHRLFVWARRHRCTYSRYADDLAFSSTHRGLSERALAELRSIIEEEGFKIHPEKWRTMPYYERQVVTGLVVNGASPRVPREYHRALRALLRNAAKHGWESQLDRQAAFESMEAYRMFRSGEMPWEERKGILRRQRKQNLLLHPAAPIRGLSSRYPTQRRVRRFQRIVLGRIDFVGQVHGRESALYKRLRSAYDHALRLYHLPGAAPPLAAGQPTSVAGTRALPPKRRLPPTDLGYPSAEASAEASALRQEAYQLADEIRAAVTLEDQHALRPVLQGWLEERAPAAPEFRDVLDRLEKHPESQAELQETAELLRSTAEHVAAHPLVTATFFKGFYRDTEFKNLLHDKLPDRPASEAFAASLQRYEQFEPHLPPSVRKVLLVLLNEAGDALKENPNLHPYSNPAYKEKLKAIKQALRVDFLNSASKEDSTHLPHWLNTVAEGLAEEFGREFAGIERDSKPQRLYVPVQPLQQGMTEVLRSMFENTHDGATIRITYGREQEGLNQRVWIRIADDDPACEQPAQLAHLAKGKLERALRAFRGIAEWSLVAHFDGTPARFDFTRNEALPVSDPVDGVMHEIILHHLES